MPIVSVVMPVRNEAATIDEALDAIERQTYPSDHIETFVIDGNSTDETAAIVARRMRRNARVRLVTGDYNCPAAMNAGIALSRGVIVAKIDGHGRVNPTFLEVGVRYLMEHPECACVGGQIIPIGRTLAARSNMYTRFSRFGVGSGVYTSAPTLHDADTVQCGIYRKDSLIQAGGFDSTLQFGEDEEVNHRLVGTGFRIVFHPGMQFHYHVRPSFRSLFRQYRNYGGARVKVLRKHPDFFRLKHVAPAATVISLIAALVVAVPSSALRLPAAGLLLAYGSFLAAGAVSIGLRHRFFYFHYLAVSLLMLHFGYGIGMIREVCRSALQSRRV